MKRNGTRVLMVPRTIKESKDAVAFYERLVSEVPKKQAEFPSILDLFKVLDKYLVDVAPEIRDLVLRLDVEWQTYLKKLMEAEEMLEIARDDFKKNLLQQADKFKTVIKELLADFMLKIPTSAST